MILKIYFHIQFTKKANKDIIAFHMLNASIFSSCSFFIFLAMNFISIRPVNAETLMLTRGGCSQSTLQ